MLRELLIGIIGGLISGILVSYLFLKIADTNNLKGMIKQEKLQVLTFLLSIEYELSYYLSQVDGTIQDESFNRIQRKVRLVPTFFSLDNNPKTLSDNFYKVYSELKYFLINFNNEMIQGFDIGDRPIYFRNKRELIWGFIDTVQKTDPIKKCRILANED